MTILASKTMGTNIDSFYFEFLLDLKIDQPVFDLNEALSIIGPVDGKIVSAADLLLRYTNLEDRIYLIEQLENITQSRSFSCFYRWEIPDQPLKILEVRAHVLDDHRIKGVIIDQTCNSDFIFPKLTLDLVSQIRGEKYLLLNSNGKEIFRNFSDSKFDPTPIYLSAKDFLAQQKSLFHSDHYSLYKIPQGVTSQTENNESAPSIFCIIYEGLNPALTGFEVVSQLSQIVTKHNKAIN